MAETKGKCIQSAALLIYSSERGWDSSRWEAPNDRLEGAEKEQERKDGSWEVPQKGRLPMQSITDLWQRIDQWLATHAPRILEELNPGASEADLAEAEAALGFALPPDFKAFYRAHNGGGNSLLGLLEHMGEGFFSLKNVVASRWQNELSCAADPADFVTNPERKPPPVQPVMYHPGWVIFAASAGNGTYQLGLDLAPAMGGQVGQILLHEIDVGPTLVIASNLS
jgi:cell wall assembly regulator SMI1